MHFNIGIDGRPLCGHQTGVGRYLRELCVALDNHTRDLKFFVYSNRDFEMPVLSKNWVKRLDHGLGAKYLKPVLWLKLKCHNLFREDRLDLFWSSATFFPRKLNSIKKITTVHDLNYLIVPQTLTWTHLLSNALFFKTDLKKADAIITNSYGTAQRLREKLKIYSSITIQPGVAKSFKRIPDPANKEFLKNMGINFPYFLAVATKEPRKNLHSLLRAFIDLKEEGKLNEYKLILVGSSGWKNRPLNHLLSSDKGEIIDLGFVSDETLINLFSGCIAFVFPSLYEGFGMPILEAKACGARVITTDSPELREAGGEHAIYISNTISGIQSGMLKAVNSHSFPSPDSENDRDSWDYKGRQLSCFIRDLLNQK